MFLFCAAVLLLTGASVAGVLRATGTGVADTTRALRSAVPARRPSPLRPDDHDPECEREPRALRPPEPADAEVVIRSTHVEAPSLDGATRYPDLFGEPVPERDDRDEPPAEERARRARA